MPDSDGVILDWYDWINVLNPIVGYRQKNGVIQVQRKAIGKRFSIPPDRAGQGIMRLSKKSLTRLALVVMTSDVKWESMLTLTYADICKDGREVKRQLNHFLTWVRRKFEGVKYVWFLEFQKRGSPHLHIFLTIKNSLDTRIEVAKVWSEITTPDLETRAKVYLVHSHKKAFEEIRVPDACARYALKYALKTTQKRVPIDYSNVGRFWGCSRAVVSVWPNYKPTCESELRELVSRYRPGFEEAMPHFTPSVIFAVDITDKMP